MNTLSGAAEVDFLFKIANLATLALAGEGLVRQAVGEDLTKAASSATDPAARAMAKTASFTKLAMPEFLQRLGLDKDFNNTVDQAGLGGGALGGLTGYGLGSSIGKTVGKAVMKPGQTEEEQEQYNNRLRLAGLAMGIPGAIGGAMLGRNAGTSLAERPEVNQMLQGINRESIGNFLEKITPEISWKDPVQ